MHHLAHHESAPKKQTAKRPLPQMETDEHR
jgi:hypothetical protein